MYEYHPLQVLKELILIIEVRIEVDGVSRHKVGSDYSLEAHKDCISLKIYSNNIKLVILEYIDVWNT